MKRKPKKNKRKKNKSKKLIKQYTTYLICGLCKNYSKLKVLPDGCTKCFYCSGSKKDVIKVKRLKK